MLLQCQEGAAAGGQENGGWRRCRAARVVADRPHRLWRACEGKLEQVRVRSPSPLQRACAAKGTYELFEPFPQQLSW